jgi:hypothetical protein
MDGMSLVGEQRSNNSYMDSPTSRVTPHISNVGVVLTIKGWLAAISTETAIGVTGSGQTPVRLRSFSIYARPAFHFDVNDGFRVV